MGLASVARRSGVLVIAALLSAGLVGAAPAPAAEAGPPEVEFLGLVNAERAAAGLAPLRYHPAVADVSERWSNNMAATGQLVHNPIYVAEVAAVAPGVGRQGENIGTFDRFPGDVAALHALFMGSVPHRANILGDFDAVGIGVVLTGTDLWVTFNFLEGGAAPPPPPPGPGGFCDTFGHPLGPEIAAVAAAGIAQGGSDGCYRPQDPVTRGQMAAFLTRGYDLPVVAGQPGFCDTAGTTFAREIGAVAAAGIAAGGTDGCYRPSQAVSRGQMAVFLARAEQLADAAAPVFCDTARHQFSGQIAAVAAAGIAQGGTDGCYRPSAAVTRAQMAAFLARALDLI